MRLTEKDRRELINKLKKVRDPGERDRIIWALAGQEEAVYHNARPDVPPSRFAAGPPEPKRTVPEDETDLRNLPKVNVGARRMFGFVVPAFFMIFGIVQIGRAILNFMASQEIETEIPRLITGGIFLIIGLAGGFRAMQPQRMKPDETS